jgi:type I restriction enzyme S subunit
VRIAEEVRRLMEASATQEVAARTSLVRIGDLTRELISAAVEGTLVPQVSTDEPAGSMLERLGPPPVRSKLKRAALLQNEVKMSKRQAAKGPAPPKPLSEALRATGGPLRVPELFALAGYDRNSTEDVERFYLALRLELGKTIRKSKGDGEEVLVEVMSNAT